ncbi:MAG: hypothetical protein IJU26_02355 [Synergistaceae bacterium]|nr:hypothetical protein [Synergistaceae bacterium]
MKIYLDHNVYINCQKCRRLRDFVSTRCDSECIQVLYSPAHIEEVYRVDALPNSPHKAGTAELLKIIDEITHSTEILPSDKGLVIMHEKTSTVYRRVKTLDTTAIVEQDSKARFQTDSEHYTKMREEDRRNQFISNIAPAEIWDYLAVKDRVDNFNEHSIEIVRAQNHSLRMLASMLISGTDRRLPEDLYLKKGIYNTRLKHSHKELEYTIEILMGILNLCGYHAEKKEENALSSIHDTTHCIYATAADYFISMDKRFSRKCEAVYSFLGVDTQVQFCDNIAALESAIRNL